MKGIRSVLVAAVILIVLIALPISASYAKSVRGVTDTTITVGGIWDFTGPAVTIMTPVANGSRTYLRHVNDQGGVNGREIKYILEDDR
ncbi:MAG: ABC transporter substrate-binding protein, partial [Pseudomonadota bacterium]